MKLQQLSLSDLYGLKKSIEKGETHLFCEKKEKDSVYSAVFDEIVKREDAIVQEVTETPIKENLIGQIIQESTEKHFLNAFMTKQRGVNYLMEYSVDELKSILRDIKLNDKTNFDVS